MFLPSTTSDDDKADEDLKHLWRAVAFHFADWLTLSMTTVDRRGIYTFDSGSITKELVPTMYYAYSSELLSVRGSDHVTNFVNCITL
jgi:hypothetical protein